jgi:hypothetical protein
MDTAQALDAWTELCRPSAESRGRRRGSGHAAELSSFVDRSTTRTYWMGTMDAFVDGGPRGRTGACGLDDSQNLPKLRTRVRFPSPARRVTDKSDPSSTTKLSPSALAACTTAVSVASAACRDGSERVSPSESAPVHRPSLLPAERVGTKEGRGTRRCSSAAAVPARRSDRCGSPPRARDKPGSCGCWPP